MECIKSRNHRTKSSTMPQGATSPTRIHLLYGNDEVKLNDARLEVVSRFLLPEDRAGNLTEVRPAGTQPLKLERALPEITAELGTISLLGDIPRVVVIHNVADFFGAPARKPPSAAASAKKKAPVADPVELLSAFLLGPFAQGANVALFVCEEDEDKGKAVDENSPLFKLIARLGERRVFREKPIARDLEDALYTGDWAGALEVMRRWRERAGSDSSARQKLYRTVSHWVETIVQAKSLQDAESDGQRAPSDLVPANSWPSIHRAPDFRRRQANQLARALSWASLRSMVEGVHRVQKLMYPIGDERYVADWGAALEHVLVGFGAAGCEA